MSIRQKMFNWWLPLLLVVISGIAGSVAAMYLGVPAPHFVTGHPGGYRRALAAMHGGVPAPLLGFFGCSLWTLGASGAGLLSANMKWPDVCLVFAGAVLIYFFAGQVAVPNTMIFGTQFLLQMSLAITAPVAALCLGLMTRRFGTAGSDAGGDMARRTGVFWAVFAGLQTAPIMLLFVGLALAIGTGFAYAQQLPHLFWKEAFPLLLALYAPAPWMWATGTKPTRFRIWVAASGAAGIAAVGALAAFYTACVLPHH